MDKSTRVRSKYAALGKIRRGVVTGNLAGFILVQWDGMERDYGYLPSEVEHDTLSKEGAEGA